MQLPLGVVVLLAVVAILLLAAAMVLISWQATLIAWSFWSYYRDVRRIDLGREFRCDQGLFVRKEHGWVAEQDIGGVRLTLDVRDDHGSPDAVFLRRLPAIIADLDQLERTARERVADVTHDYVLESILSPVRVDDPYDFALGFSPREETFEISIYVNFKGD